VNQLARSAVINGAVNLVVALRDLCFPPACAACGARLHSQGPFCATCAEQVRLLSQQEPNSTAHALAEYGGPLAEALRGFKYKRRLAGGAALAKWLARAIPGSWLDQVDVIAPVPLHPRRLLARGFNQAVVLFRPLAEARGIALEPRVLARLRHTRPQTGLKPAERRSNVAGAFGLRRPGLINNRKVLLVDDVFTTGATAHECAQVLLDAGAAEVSVLTLAKAGSGAVQTA
jgi:ComF family protein